MHNTFANNLLQSITEFSSLVFEADRAQKDSDRMNVRRALDYQESQGRNSADTPKPASNASREFAEVKTKIN